MEFLGVFVSAILIILSVLEWTILIWVILSWVLFFMRDSKFRWRHRGFFQILTQLDDIFTRMTYPLLKPFRVMLRRVNTAGIDWSPLLLLISLFILRGLIVAGYNSLARA